MTTLDFDIRATIRTIPDFPKPGIQFRDVTTLFAHPRAFRQAVDALVQPYTGSGVAVVAGIEARGFILGGAAAHQLSAGFVPVRKAGKLPAAVHTQAYTLEYGEAAVEIHQDAIAPGTKVLVMDDLIATGGTALAAMNLLRRAGADVLGMAALVDLPDLGGSAAIRAAGYGCAALVAFEGE